LRERDRERGNREMELKQLIENQRKFFATYTTKDINFRLSALKKLREALFRNEDKINAALFQDLHRSEAQAFITEIGLCLQESGVFIRNLKKWAKHRKAAAPFIFPFSQCYVKPEPFGVALIISPWNYPFFLSLLPLMAAVAAGNCVILKPSRVSAASLKVLDEIIFSCFAEEHVKVLQLGSGSPDDMLKEKFDYIFFTGGPETGKKVLAAAAEHITPVTLELGGKCPCIVDADIDIEKTAARIAFGKWLNAGQTCVAPDYLIAHKEIKDKLVEKIKQNMVKMFGSNPEESSDFGRIISNNEFDRVASYAQGINTDKASRYIAPSIVENPPLDSVIMKEEVFGPILPVITYNTIDEAISYVNDREKPLVLYIFSRNKKVQEKVLNETSSGNACVNDVVVQLSAPGLPFGGAGGSGFGRYRGKFGFDTFSNLKSVMKQTNLIDIPLRYAPLSKFALKVFKFFLR
jgi:acyl-CoA reductase-like NAD-dependent aldehyde dehydrogenase